MTQNSVTCRIGENRYVIQSDDDYLLHIGDDFEPDMVALFASLIDRDMTIVDVGANIGCTALLFSDLGKTVHAFEPSRTTYQFLSTNLKSNGKGNVEAYNLGLGERDEKFQLSFAPENRSGGFISNKTSATQGHVTEDVEIVSGDRFFSEQNIGPVDFIKIDVEGFELDVIAGLKEQIGQHHPVVCLELNHWCLNAFQRISVPDFFDALLDVFPVLLAVDGQTFKDLHNEDDRYNVMYHHIIHFRYPNLVAAFEPAQLETFHQRFTNAELTERSSPSGGNKFPARLVRFARRVLSG